MPFEGERRDQSQESEKKKRAGKVRRLLLICPLVHRIRGKNKPKGHQRELFYNKRFVASMHSLPSKVGEFYSLI